jgi:hypothetical protein
LKLIDLPKRSTEITSMNDEDKLRNLYATLLAWHAGMSPAETARYRDFAAVVRDWTKEVSSIDLAELERRVEEHGLTDVWEKVRDSPILMGGSQYQNEIMLEEVRAAAVAYYDRPLIPMFVGEFPTREANACVMGVGPAALILINSGLTFLLNHVSDLLAGFAISNVFKDHAFEMDGRDTRSRQATVLELVNTLSWYLFLGNTNARKRAYATPGEFQYHVSTLVKQQVLKFVIAHEVAHAAREHRKEASPEQEFEADRDAFGILRSQVVGGDSEEYRELATAAQIAGPVLFLSVLRLLEAAHLRQPVDALCKITQSAMPTLPKGYHYARAEGIGITHPPASDRLVALRGDVPNAPLALDIAARYSNALDELETEILDALEANCVKITRRSRPDDQSGNASGATTRSS